MLAPPIDLNHRQYILMMHRLYVDTRINLKLSAFVNFPLLIRHHRLLIYCNPIDLKPLNVVKNGLKIKKKKKMKINFFFITTILLL